MKYRVILAILAPIAVVFIYIWVLSICLDTTKPKVPPFSEENFMSYYPKRLPYNTAVSRYPKQLSTEDVSEEGYAYFLTRHNPFFKKDVIISQAVALAIAKQVNASSRYPERDVGIDGTSPREVGHRLMWVFFAVSTDVGGHNIFVDAYTGDYWVGLGFA